MTDTALPRQRDAFGHDALMGSLLYQRRIGVESSQIELLPNPDFVFPIRTITPPDSAASNTTVSSTGRPTSAQMPTTSRRAPTSGPRQRKSVSALPNFSFNPSGAGPTSPTATTPPRSPTSPVAITPSRAIGHRRRGSEFIGGDSRFGGAGLMSTSPTKRDAVPPPPPSEVRLGPPAGRRGHAHRRSGAISCHDLQSILQPPAPNAQLRSGSAPTSPMEFEPKSRLVQQGRRTMSQSSLRSSSMDESSSTQIGTEYPQRPPSRARVGFSERVEYIRPLSTISSETESSMSTIRGHSVSGSLSSLNSNGAASPPSARMARPSLDTTFEDELPRPRPTTAGEILDCKTKRNGDVQQESTTYERPKSSISSSGREPNFACRLSPPQSPGRSSFFWLEHNRSESSLSSSPLPKAVSDTSLIPTTPESPPANLTVDEPEIGVSEPVQEGSAHLKVARTPRKVKSWAHSIISRKPKASYAKSPGATVDPATEASPVGSPFAFPSSVSDNADYFANFDVDDTVVIVTPPANEVPQPRLDTSIPAWRPRQDLSQATETMSPVIDLDAALGPFSTPGQGFNQRSQGRGFPSARRSMHSGVFNPAIFSGNGLNHRRTESAPALVPFELRNTGALPPTMADVFEEEEEDEEGDGAASSEAPKRDVPENGTEVRVENTKEEAIFSEEDTELHDDSGVDMSHTGTALESESRPAPVSNASVQSAPAELGSSPQKFKRVDSHSSGESTVEIVEAFEEPRASSFTKDSDSTVTPTLTAQHSKEPPPLLNLSLSRAHQTAMTPDTFSNSTFSSPDFNHSQCSFDTPRLGTAASSMTDKTCPSFFTFGEPAPEFRVSVDDVPSLTSSRSTMTSPPQHPFGPTYSRPLDERSGSVSSTPGLIDRRRSRSSIASLSRLMGGSFGERSKLSIEQRPVSEHIPSAKDIKPKKSKRLSKLIHFWKPKDSSRG